ncbi:hypothetical protein LY632_07005 [Erythrobacter sp. SDW2]|uniref:hypothetical protein n=1 Tax=Erythrobacter sp. SDW2 TaxID=2907154 RepID=UPI001F2B2B8F|nr:hypothetical protein [Erythrobacter sp. SDW2]UIP08137.1 hypothetical protein LY632_07005 [Erythrobacter sp. SDW2]
MRKPLTLLALLTFATPILARDSLGVYGNWGAFRDPAVPRCYAIAKAAPSKLSRDYEPYATVGTWPRRKIRGQVHFRLSREIRSDRPINLNVGGNRFTLAGGGGDAWALDKAMDAAIVAAMRSAGRMTIGATDKRGTRFSNTYDLKGAATAMDAATVACAGK